MYNTKDSPVVTDPTTGLALSGLSMGERTGSRAFQRLWSYMEGLPHLYRAGVKILLRPDKRVGPMARVRDLRLVPISTEASEVVLSHIILLAQEDSL
ncbi:hypothetical protein F5Y12DRAFT_720290 [Xylaria sp. FL1777]|nr:hypothetical protein F5Y12DRAFT_720290 [Xylaria sp. FL1777]